MTENDHFKFSYGMLLVPLLAVLSIWTVFWIEVQFGVNFNDYGIYPRRLSGIRGVLFSPFIHGSVEHLYNNTIPLAVLTGFLFYFYRQVAWRTLFLGLIVSGLLTWVIGRPSYHIGASGIIYVLASFIFFKGVFAKHFRLIALSLIVVFIYGSMIWYIFPIEEGISWEGHLSGFLTGFLLALMIKVRVPNEKKYEWEKEDYDEEEDAFLKHFDEDGNFIENNHLVEEGDKNIKITYHYKKEEDK
ncbi:rhomboid family intramembrane serine protease [Flagellimonas pacifica]|uniref:Membrane associated serine protease, rhomboid family n=1 Tax=Flagellimonas pacifica TaxID=1247520 RepID=A0A285MWK5_9FLAO|nr:rhomboid family intramembrane serine protease [Allomuricauda parva]SNZ01572.1 Membrane associated serine protease, rhomboid family [Allomuricauda parva]